MSDVAVSTISEDIPQAEPPAIAEESRTWATPNEHGVFEEPDKTISAPGNLDCTIDLVVQPDGWRAAWSAQLPSGGRGAPIRKTDPVYATRELATIAACESLISWLSEEKERDTKAHRKAAAKLQEWALDLENRATFAEQTAAAGSHEKPQALQPAQAAADLQGPRQTDVAALRARTNIVAEGELRLIPIEQLYESPWNPRQYYSEAETNELVESMRASGFRQWLPLMVRPIPEASEIWRKVGETGGYEIGAGHRRRRAAELAGIKEIPCIVRELSDEQFLDVLNFDNCGRSDVHPLHEAAGWRVWMEKTGHGVRDIAARIGQSIEYVYQRLKYAALIPEAQQSFLDNKITARQAVQIARQSEADQKQALKYCLTADWSGNLPSARALAEWLHDNAYRDLRDCPFDRQDRNLLAGAGSCVECPKRAANIPLFEFDPEDQNADLCTDRVCYGQKITNHLVQLKAEIQAKQGEVLEVTQEWRTKKKGLLPREQWETAGDGASGKNVKTALIVEGPDIGKVVAVRVKPAPAARPSGPSKEQQEQIRKREEQKAQAELSIRRAILLAIRPKIGGLTRVDVEALLVSLFRPRVEACGAPELCRLHEIKFKTDWQAGEALGAALPKMAEPEIVQVAVEVSVMEDFEEWNIDRHEPKALLALAKRYKVDAAKIRREMEEAAKAAVTAEDGRKAVVARLPNLAQARAGKKPAAKKKAAAKKPKPAPKKKAKGKK